MINSPPDVRETFFEPVECSMRNEGNAEIMNMLCQQRKKWRRERKGGSSNIGLEKNFWKLNSEEESKDGNNYSRRVMKSGRKKWRGEKEH